MKKVWIVIALLLILTGCSDTPTFETMTDVFVPLQQQPEHRLTLTLPDGAVQAVMGTEGAKLYLCDQFSVIVQTMNGGDLNRTLTAMTGFSEDALTVMQTTAGGIKRYECAWCAAGEGQTQMLRGLILDDGNYHYTVTVMAEADIAGALSNKWQQLMESAQLETVVSTDP